MDRSEQEVIGTHHLCQLHTFRQVFAYFVQQVVDVLVYFRSIGAGRLEYHTGNTIVTVHTAFVGITFLTQFHICNVFQLQHFTVFRRTDYDFTKFLRRNQTTFILHSILISFVRIFTERTGSRFNILLGKCCRHVRRNQFVLCHHIRLHPDTHTVVTTHNHHIAHTRNTQQLRFQVDTHIVGKEVFIIRIIGTMQ